jgi:hypothetical protein
MSLSRPFLCQCCRVPLSFCWKEAGRERLATKEPKLWWPRHDKRLNAFGNQHITSKPRKGWLLVKSGSGATLNFRRALFRQRTRGQGTPTPMVASSLSTAAFYLACFQNTLQRWEPGYCGFGAPKSRTLLPNPFFKR